MGGCESKQGSNPRKKTFLLEVVDDHEAGINCMTLSEDGSVLATGSEDCTARLFTTKTEHCECIGILKGHEDYINCIAIEENFVLTGSADKTLRKWDMGTCDCVHVFTGHTSLINRIICTGDFIFSSSYDRTARCWDFDTGECVRVFSGHKRGVYPLIFIPADDEEVSMDDFDWDGNKDLLITGGADFTARSWSFETGKCLKLFKGHTGAITCMSTDSSGKTLFTGGTDQTVRSWHTLKGEQIRVFEGHQASIISLIIVNKIMFTTSSDHTARSWVTEFGDCTRTFKGHRHTVSCIKYNHGFIYTGSGDGVAMCFDAKSGALKRTFNRHEYAINCLQIVDNKLFTGSHDGTLRVWDTSGIVNDKFGKVNIEKSEKVEKAEGDDTTVDKNANNMKSSTNGTTRIVIDEEGKNGYANNSFARY